jgi:P4 family phage/plasmid primase-like protien
MIPDDAAAAYQFLQCLYSDNAPGWLTMWLWPSKYTHWVRTHNLEAAATYAVRQAQQCDVYVGIGLRGERLHKGRGEAKDVIALPGLYADIDLKHPAHKAANLPQSIDEARQLLTEAIPLPPTMLIDSGHGLHGYWLWRELWLLDTEAERQTAARLLLQFQRTIQAAATLHGWHVDGVGDLARVLRLPGTCNRKIPDRIAPVAFLEVNSDTRYTASDFTAYLVDVDQPTNGQPSGDTYTGELLPIELQVLKIQAWLKYLIHVGKDPDYQSGDSTRSAVEFKALQGLIEAGIDDQTIMSVMLDPRYGISAKPREKGRKWLAGDLARAHAKVNGHRRASTGDKDLDRSDAESEVEMEDEPHAAENGDMSDAPGTDQRQAPRPKRFFREKTFIPKRLGDYLLTQYHIKYAAEMLWVYRNGVYVPDGARILAAAAQQLLGEERRQNRIEETLRYIEVATYAELPPPDLRYINLLNGRLEWATGALHKHAPEVFTVIQLPVRYDSDATCPTFDQYLKTTLDEDVIPLVEEVMGDHLIPDTRYEKATMLTGVGENGKSVFIDTLTALLGPQHVSNVALQDLEENRFRVAELFGKLGNFFADLDPRALKSSSMFKTLVTGDEIQAERKFKDPFKFRNVARLLFSANKLPDTSDRTHAFYRRWHVIPFTRTFTGSNRDPELREKLARELPGIFLRALTGLKRLSEQKAFTVPQAVRDALSHYERQNDSLAAFLEEAVDIGPTFSVTKQRFYQRYCRWCDAYRLRRVGQKELRDRLYTLVPELDEARFDARGVRANKGPWRWIGIQPIDERPDADEG